MPPGAPTEPADALKSDLGTEVAPQDEATPEPSYREVGKQFLVNPESVLVKSMAAFMSPATYGLRDSAVNDYRAVGSAAFEAAKAMLVDAPKASLDASKELQQTGQLSEEAAGENIKAVAGMLSPGITMAERGAAGVFGGKLSQTANLDNYKEAQIMFKEGASVKQIHDRTGWTVDPVGNLKYEISDHNAKLGPYVNSVRSKKTFEGGGYLLKDESSLKPPDPATVGTPLEGHPLDKVLIHPELYKAYPFLKDVIVRELPSWSSDFGSYSPKYNVIAIAKQSTGEFMRTLIHEVQHAIQHYEKFPGGDNPKRYLPPEYHEMKKDLYKVYDSGNKYLKHLPEFKNTTANIHGATVAAKEILTGNTQLLLPVYKEFFDKHPELIPLFNKVGELRDVLKVYEKEALEKYKKSIGEVEADNAEKRLTMSPKDRRNYSPKTTQKYPDIEQQPASNFVGQQMSLSNRPQQWTPETAPGKINWTEDMDKTLVQSFNQRMNLRDIADQIGIGYEVMLKRIKQLDLKREPLNTSNTVWKSPEMVNRLTKMFHAGTTRADMANFLGVGERTITRKLKELGLESQMTNKRYLSKAAE
jgi:hypothetical protein